MLSINPQYSTALHDMGYVYGKSNFKQFTFGPLKGNGVINTEDKTITLNDFFYLEVRSPDPVFCDTLSAFLNLNDFCNLSHHVVEIFDYSIFPCPILPEDINILMLSPIVIYHTVNQNGKNKTVYHNPLDENYGKYVNDNFQKKFYSAYQTKAPADIELTMLSVRKSDKYITKYDNTYFITGWKGKFNLKGDPFALQYLYETGIGSKNSQGFGMFKIYY